MAWIDPFAPTIDVLEAGDKFLPTLSRPGRFVMGPPFPTREEAADWARRELEERREAIEERDFG